MPSVTQVLTCPTLDNKTSHEVFLKSVWASMSDDNSDFLLSSAKHADRDGPG